MPANHNGTGIMKVRCIPSSPRWMDSLYVGNLARGLQDHGVAFDLPSDEGGDFLSARWLRAHAGDVDLLHFHWSHYHYTADTWMRSAPELVKFIGKIVLARRLGYRIVWTMHNYMPHERWYPMLHYMDRLALARLSHSVIVHCAHGRDLLAAKLARHGNVSVIPHGDFGPYMPPLPPRSQAREQLQIPEQAIVFYFFGSIRPYKQVPHLIREFATLPGANLVLIVTGLPLNEALRTEIEDLAALDSRVRHRLEYIPDQELASYLAAADVAVLPFRDILASGSVMTALSSGLPVVAPRLGCLPELITPACGVLYDPGPGALAAALEQSLSSNLESMGHAAKARARQFPWEAMVQATHRVYQKALGAG